MHVKKHKNLTTALKTILSLRQNHPDKESRVFLHNRLIYATYEHGRTTLLNLRGDERQLFSQMVRLMLKPAL